jgi:hypothetical protein
LSQESRPEGGLLQEVLQQVQNALQRQRVEHDGGEQADVEGVVGVVDVEKDDIPAQLSREVEADEQDERGERPVEVNIVSC